jgi:hypothetical protein
MRVGKSGRTELKRLATVRLAPLTYSVAAPSSEAQLPAMGVHEVHELIVHPVRLVPAGVYRPGRAMLLVVPHQLAAHATKRFVDGGDLREDVGAVPVVIDHLLKSAHLTFDAAQSLEIPGLHIRVDCDCFSRAGGFLNSAAAFGGHMCRFSIVTF